MKKTTAKKVNEYCATVKVLGKTYTANGLTIAEAIGNLKPVNCKGRSVLTVKNGTVSKDRILMPVITHRLFNTHGFSREIAIKNASLLFQGL